MALNFFAGLVRRLTIQNYAEGAQPAPQLNHRGESILTQGLPERSELVRQGNSWGILLAATTSGALTAAPFTFVNAWPTTQAQLTLANGEPTGGKSYLIDRVWMVTVTSETAAQPFTILGQLNPASNNSGPGTNNTTTSAIYSMRGDVTGAQYAGNARKVVGSTSFALANQWFSLGVAAVCPFASPNLGMAAEAFCYGRYIVPPGAQFSIAGLAGAATGTALCGIEWHEIQLPLF